MKYRVRVLLFIIFCLFIGALIYAITRPDNIYLNRWIDLISDGSIRRGLLSLISVTNLPNWIIYSLPDALWMLGLVTLVLLIWDFKINSRSIPWIILAILTGIFYEIFQAFRLVKGTFDIIDIGVMIVAALIPLSLTYLKQFSCKTL